MLPSLSGTQYFIQGVAIGSDKSALIVVNQSGAEVSYSSSSGLVFYPTDSRLPPLPLANLDADVNVANNQQEILIFSVDTSAITAALRTSSSGAGNNEPVIFGYFSRPASDAPCGGGQILNDDRNDCIDSASSGATTPGNGGGSSSGNGDNNNKDIATGMLAVALFAFAVLGSEDADAFTFSPDFGYAITESGYSYNYGTRLDFAEENWRLYWTAGQTNRNGDFGDFAYASGGEYRSDSGLWTTAFSESVQGEIANYDFSLSAKASGNLWEIRPTYRFNSVLDWAKEESESHNSLNIESVVRMNRWTIRPTAGFNWRRMNEFGDSAKFGISAVHRF